MLSLSKCRHFCFSFDLHNYYLTCRESGKGDDLCVTNQAPCKICQGLSSEQHGKINNRRRYIRKVKSDANTSKDDLDLLGDDYESFTGSQADLEGAADTLFSSPAQPLPLRFEALSIKIPHNVPPTPGTVLQTKIDNRLEKSLGNTFNIQLKQEMGLFQASMLDAMKSLRDEMHALRNKESDVDKTSDLAQAKPMPGTSTSNPTRTSDPVHSDPSEIQPVDMEPYGPQLPPKSTQILNPSMVFTRILTLLTQNKPLIPSITRQDLNIKNTLIRGNISPNPSIKNLSHLQRKMSPLHILEGLHNIMLRFLQKPEPQASSDPVFYREVDMNDLPSQYTEKIETFRQILDLPDPRETMPRSSTTVLGLDNEKG